MLILVIVAILVGGCIKSEATPIPFTYAPFDFVYIPELDEFACDFFLPRNVNIQFEYMDLLVVDPLLGLRKAHAYTNILYGNIVFNKDWWKVATRWEKLKVLYHEFGHAYFGLDHTRNPLDYSIMNSTLLTVFPNGGNWRELVEELRDRVFYAGSSPGQEGHFGRYFRRLGFEFGFPASRRKTPKPDPKNHCGPSLAKRLRY